MANYKDQNLIFVLLADRPVVSRLLAFVIGCATTLVFAPAEWSILAPVLTLPLLLIALTLSPKDAAAHYFWFGLGLFLTGTYWIYISVHVFGNAALWIAILLPHLPAGEVRENAVDALAPLLLDEQDSPPAVELNLEP